MTEEKDDFIIFTKGAKDPQGPDQRVGDVTRDTLVKLGENGPLTRQSKIDWAIQKSSGDLLKDFQVYINSETGSDRFVLDLTGNIKIEGTHEINKEDLSKAELIASDFKAKLLYLKHWKEQAEAEGMDTKQ